MHMLPPLLILSHSAIPKVSYLEIPGTNLGVKVCPMSPQQGADT